MTKQTLIILAAMLAGGAVTTIGMDILIKNADIAGYVVRYYCGRIDAERRFEFRRQVNISSYPHTIEIGCDEAD